MNSKLNLLIMIDNVNGVEISEMWKNHSESVFNCVNGSDCSDVYDDLCNKHTHYDQSMVVSAFSRHSTTFYHNFQSQICQ